MTKTLLKTGMLIAAISIIAVSVYKMQAAVIQTPQQTGYYVEVASLTVPTDITESTIATFVVYQKDGQTEIWRENVKLGKYSTDEELENALNRWADPYIARYEKKVALKQLAQASQIIGKKLPHTTVQTMQ